MSLVTIPLTVDPLLSVIIKVVPSKDATVPIAFAGGVVGVVGVVGVMVVLDGVVVAFFQTAGAGLGRDESGRDGAYGGGGCERARRGDREDQGARNCA